MAEIYEDAYDDIIELLLDAAARGDDDAQKVKLQVCKKYALDFMPRNSDVLARLDDDEREQLIRLLQKKPTRTMSGVAIVAVMTSPANCPHGKCLYCPGGVENNSAQSYTGKEPAALRAGQHNFDPYTQITDRIGQLRRIGHPTDKIELVVMGGTFPARDEAYQTEFIKRCFDAMNGEDSPTLEEAQIKNENAPSRCVGLTIETRPDYGKQKHTDRMLAQGCTRVELGVQTVYDDVLLKIKRGHAVGDSIEATRIAKDAGLKVCYHMMPGLPGSDLDRDYNAFKEIFNNPDFKPDLLKIYPALVIEDTGLYDAWKSGEYVPLETEQATKLISEVKKLVPKWVRIQRIQRDIPAKLVEAGIKKSDLRVLVQKRLEEEGANCMCIRCREVGQRFLKKNMVPNAKDIALKTERYEASQGTEYFLSFEDSSQDILIGYLRLRLSQNGGARVRELHVCGSALPVGKEASETTEWQHRGYGEELLKEAERMVREEWNEKKIAVTSGVGARNYYRKFGYERDMAYMVKRCQ